MRRAILLYNPKAGNRQIVNHLDYITKRIQRMGYELRFYRSESRGAIEKYILEYITEENTDIVLISGGDGTIHECVNGLFKKNLKLPVGILPLGTANDFAHTAQIATNIRGALDVIEENYLVDVDLGKANDRYFINVCNMGLFSGVSHVTDLELKKSLGKFAYYMKSMEELHGYQAMDLQIKIEDKEWQDKYVLVLIFNGKGAGGFDKLAKNASIVDGKFEVVAIKNVELYEIPRIFFKVLQGEHLGDPNVDYFSTDKIRIDCINKEEQFAVDVDGEKGPDFPLNVEMIESGLKIFMSKKYNQPDRKTITLTKQFNQFRENLEQKR